MEDLRRFAIYLTKFETRVVIAGILARRFTSRDGVVIRRSLRLDKSPLGRLVGNRFRWERPAAIEYFGVVKRSTGFVELAGLVHEPLRRYGLCELYVPIVNFSSVTVEDVARFAPDLVEDFPAFKERMVRARWDRA